MNSEKTTNHASRLGSRGFTLIEIIVILAVISILVAFLTPSVLKYVADAQSARAQADMSTLQAVVNDLIRDTGQYPGSKTALTFICGPGNVATPGATGWAANTAACTAGTGVFTNSLSNHLVANDPNESGTTTAADYPGSGNFRWKGPYAQSINTDPWGNAYEINVSTLVGGNTSPTWIISAGPDGTFQTSTTATILAGDDIGVRVK
jgi:prepilin-type N-terminal cleavage/methylation domain-containing protein